MTAENLRGVLSVPILGSGGAMHGALSAYWGAPHAPSSAEVELMSAFAGQAAIALENAPPVRGTRHPGQPAPHARLGSAT